MKLGLNKGAITLPVFLVMTAVVVELALAGVLAATALTNIFFGERLNVESLQAARAGAQDAMMIVTETCPLTACLSGYTLTVGTRATADVTVNNDTVNHLITIDSVGSVLSRKKKIEAILNVDPSTGQTQLRSFGEVSL